MKRLFARLFGGRGAAARAADSSAAVAPSPTPQPPSPTPAVPAGAAGAQASPADLDLAFFHWLASPYVSSAPIADAPIFDELARLARDPVAAAALVPRVPAVIPQLLRTLRTESSSTGELARQVAQDAVLVAEVIREVNSSHYRPATPVRNLEGALLLLGQNGLRMLLARVAFRPIISLQAGPLARQVAPQLWRQSEKCALAAALLAPRRGADPFEGYLAGLMHQIGLVVAFRVIDQLAPLGALPDADDFGVRLGQAARRISAGIALQWELPPPIAQAIADPGGALGAVLALADQLAKLRMLADSGQPPFVQAAAGLDAGLQRAYDQLGDHPDQEA